MGPHAGEGLRWLRFWFLLDEFKVGEWHHGMRRWTSLGWFHATYNVERLLAPPPLTFPYFTGAVETVV